MTLQAMDVDALVVRHSSEGVPFHMTEWTDLSVINAGDGTNSHPTQALLDLYTIREQLGRLDVRVAIVGDVLHSRVARSLTEALERVGADVVLVGPPDLMSKSGRITDNLDSVLPGLDVCYMLRVQRERGAVVGDDYARDYALTRARVEMLPMHALIMHPGPVNQGVEVESGVTDSYRSVIQRQVTNGVAVRMAVLYEILGEHDAD
jgi:aspartate carbamoyltransferase catalytic subunit